MLTLLSKERTHGRSGREAPHAGSGYFPTYQRVEKFNFQRHVVLVWKKRAEESATAASFCQEVLEARVDKRAFGACILEERLPRDGFRSVDSFYR